MPFSRVVDLAAHENGTGSVAEGARFVMIVRVIFVVNGRRHFWFYFTVFIFFTVYFFLGVFDEMLVGWLDWYIDDDDDDDDIDVSSLTGLGLVACRMTCALGYFSLLLSSELCHYEDTSLSILVARGGGEVSTTTLLPPTCTSYLRLRLLTSGAPCFVFERVMF